MKRIRPIIFLFSVFLIILSLGMLFSISLKKHITIHENLTTDIITTIKFSYAKNFDYTQLTIINKKGKQFLFNNGYTVSYVNNLSTITLQNNDSELTTLAVPVMSWGEKTIIWNIQLINSSNDVIKENLKALTEKNNQIFYIDSPSSETSSALIKTIKINFSNLQVTTENVIIKNTSGNQVGYGVAYDGPVCTITLSGNGSELGTLALPRYSFSYLTMVNKIDLLNSSNVPVKTLDLAKNTITDTAIFYKDLPSSETSTNKSVTVKTITFKPFGITANVGFDENNIKITTLDNKIIPLVKNTDYNIITPLGGIGADWVLTFIGSSRNDLQDIILVKKAQQSVKVNRVVLADDVGKIVDNSFINSENNVNELIIPVPAAPTLIKTIKIYYGNVEPGKLNIRNNSGNKVDYTYDNCANGVCTITLKDNGSELTTLALPKYSWTTFNPLNLTSVSKIELFNSSGDKIKTLDKIVDTTATEIFYLGLSSGTNTTKPIITTTPIPNTTKPNFNPDIIQIIKFSYFSYFDYNLLYIKNKNGKEFKYNNGYTSDCVNKVCTITLIDNDSELTTLAVPELSWTNKTDVWNIELINSSNVSKTLQLVPTTANGQIFYIGSSSGTNTTKPNFNPDITTITSSGSLICTSYC